jgi:G:T/U-mismatch repair DNA glycosylase
MNMHAVVKRQKLQATSNTQWRLAQQVLATTAELVQHALEGKWSTLSGIVERRRTLLDTMHKHAKCEDSILEALTAAVSESEQAVARVIAHAIIGAHQPGSGTITWH